MGQVGNLRGGWLPPPVRHERGSGPGPGGTPNRPQLQDHPGCFFQEQGWKKGNRQVTERLWGFFFGSALHRFKWFAFAGCCFLTYALINVGILGRTDGAVTGEAGALCAALVLACSLRSQTRTTTQVIESESLKTIDVASLFAPRKPSAHKPEASRGDWLATDGQLA